MVNTRLYFFKFVQNVFTGEGIDEEDQEKGKKEARII